MKEPFLPHYTTNADDKDYQTHIIGGAIKIIYLSALICDLKPPPMAIKHEQYMNDIRSNQTAIGSVCGRLCAAFNVNLISEAYKRDKIVDTCWRYVWVGEAIEFLEKEGVSVSEKLKEHIAVTTSTKERMTADNNSTHDNSSTEKSLYFNIYNIELKGRIPTRKEAREWFKKKTLPSTWGDIFLELIPKNKRNKSGRPQKHSAKKK